ncbi:MAG: hypothetical protein LAP21_03960 [Acidobacteriia bacterium]|nr:hypothetical protein [Terriglobia bacterium]
MSYRVTAATITLVLAIGAQSQGDRPAIVPINAVRVGHVKSGSVALQDFINQMSANTHVAFCIENRGNAMRTTLGSLSVNLNVGPNDDLRAVLTRLEQTLPVVKWTTEAGIVVISSNDIKDDPLDAVIKPSTFEGTVRDFVAFLNSQAPGLMADTLEISGMYDRKAVYRLDFKSEVRVREALSALTRDYGVRWNATIRDEGALVQVPGGTDGKPTEVRTGRVTLMFSRGPVPLLVR